ncbi:MAG: GH92 family glycosyl hydrolase [Dysgonamonadaceae bacterium]|jgi:predicted alpha-1,2-mannosidase|nr:GH92 family glycosyl hydrolase [Dysgonamonadaceae bacterium]
MKTHNLSLLIIIFTFFFTGCTQKTDVKTSKTDLVDMYMGVRGFSNCVIGPQLPHGSINPSPQTPKGHHDGYDPEQAIRGFGQLHVSGIGWGRYGQIFISPQTGFNAEETGHDSPKSNETATPYYYAVNLDRYEIRVEITPTHHCALYRFSFSKSDDANILLDIAHNIPQHIAPEVGGKFINGSITYNKETNSLEGWGEYAGGFGNGLPYKVYYYLQLDTPLTGVDITDNGSEALFAQLKLPENITTVHLNAGISFKSVDNAKKFVAQETTLQTFEEVKSTAKEKWEDVFSSIDVKGGSPEEQSLFYTTLYHSFLMPRERTGDNPNWNNENAHLDDHYCVWDTWRTKYPLMLLINESFVSKTIRSFIDRFEHDGIVTPTYTSSLEWDWKQGGDDVDNIIADAFVKGVSGFDREKAYQLVKWDAFNNRNPEYLNAGWVPETGERMSCSYTMEFAYNDFCAAQVARCMNDNETAANLFNRSGNWDKIFNTELESHGFKGFVAPRKSNGEWINIDPAKHFGSWVEYFYEGNSWVYTLFAPHQFDRLIDLCGGKDVMIERLTYGFDNKLIKLDNEPGFLSPFIFSHCNRADLTAKYVNLLRNDHFTLATGYPDNEDSGAMGAWYVFTSIGFFPNAGQDYYYLLPPAFSEITITRENGKKIYIKTEKDSPDAQYIETVSLNGKILDRNWIHHSEIADGATILYKIKNSYKK